MVCRTVVAARSVTLLLGVLVAVPTFAQGDGGYEYVDAQTARVRTFVADALPPDIEPQSLFPAALSDADALRVEAERAAAFVSLLERARSVPKKKGTPPDPDADRHAALERLERARLTFYELPADQRDALLRNWNARKQALLPVESDDARKAREADERAALALERARQARTEADRVVAEEKARLLSIESAAASLRERFRQHELALAARQEAVLGWQRRVRDAKAEGGAAPDAAYDSIRQALKSARTELDTALAVLASPRTEVPELGEDGIAGVPADVPTEDVRALRARLVTELEHTRHDETASQQARASALFNEIDTLNDERLGLLDALSGPKRDAITGFTEAGFDQARAEAWHLTLIVRYHAWQVREWVRAVRAGGSVRGAIWNTVRVGLPWLLLLAVFVSLRRRSPALVRMLDARFRDADRLERRTTPSAARRLSRVLLKTHRSLEWALFFALTMWLLPHEVQSLLEVELPLIVIGWMIVGSLIIDVINALAAGSAGTNMVEETSTSSLRLRSLRLVGRTVVLFIVFLVLTARLVGQGTIYSWVFSTCWLAAVPIVLVLVRRWRPVVYERLERTHNRSPVQTWVLKHQRGAASFVSAIVGAANLFARGTVRVVRAWLTGFDVVRRGHAYLFRRELDRLTGGNTSYAPLTSEVRAAFRPDAPPPVWLPTPSDDELERYAKRVKDRQGGVIALIGPRGMGKTAFLSELSSRAPGTVTINCAGREPAELVQALSATAADGVPLVLIDDAQALVRPVIGGLAHFDAALALARARSTHAPWIFAIDASLWPFLKRARDGRPLFDEVHRLEAWDEAQIGTLLADRSERAGVVASFDALLEGLVATADEQSRTAALRERQMAYERMLWDHVGGVPGLALEVWRSSLAASPSGAVCARPLQVPDSADLDRLPDPALFVLRAVLQLEPASVDDLVQATRLTDEQVREAVTFGRARSFFDVSDGRVSIAWPWLRPITRLLERRHLLVNS